MDWSLLPSILGRTLVAGTPLLLGTLGEITSERSGIMNLGVEGMMAVGAVSGFAVAFEYQNPWLGLLAGIVCGAVLAIVHAFFTVTLRSNQVVSGLALTTLGLGISGLMGKGYIGQPLTTKFQAVAIPLLKDIPGIGSAVFDRDPVFYLSIPAGILLWYLLFRTRWGIVIRSVGENPLAAETMGVNVSQVRYLCVVFGGGMAGAAGAYLSLAYSNAWIEGMVAGRGWIVVALTIFATWNPAWAFLGAFLFGGVEIGQFFVQSDTIPPQVLKMMPYLATLVALMLTSLLGPRHRSAPPAALGEPYEKNAR